MILWSIQPESVYTEVLKYGYCLSKKSKSDFLLDELTIPVEQQTFTRAYDWYIDEMEKRITKPTDYIIELPWWAYYRLNGSSNLKLEDVDHLDNPGSTMVALKLNVPDSEVLLSDLDLWHIVLNNGYIPDSITTDAFSNNILNHSSKTVDDNAIIDSWCRIFDIGECKNDSVTSCTDIQATFWVLKREYIVEAIRFVVRGTVD